ncbi:Equilibrative nucleoside transporter 1 [Balamuthia mandrillaris]
MLRQKEQAMPLESPLDSAINSYDKWHSEAPKDKFFLCYLVFVLLGVGALFPWNAFLTAIDYFSDLYDDFPFAFALALAYNYPSVISLLLSIRFGPKFSFTSRILFGLLVNCLVMIVVPLIKVSGVPTTASLCLTLFAAFVTGCAQAVLFGGVLGLASLFPPTYVGAVMSGNGVAGIGVGLLRIITKAAFPHALFTSAVIYFAISGAIMLMCAISYIFFLRLPYTKYHMQSNGYKPLDEASNLMENTDDTMKSTGHEEKVSYWIIFKKIWKEALLVMLVFFITLSLFPGITLKIQTTSSGLGKDWFAILMVFNFQFFDFVGRTIPRFFVGLSKRTLWLPVALRAVFYVLFILCIKPYVLRSDGWSMTLMALFALSNGYLGTLGMMFGPTSAAPHEKQVAGIVMSFFLNFGIFLATHFALVLLYAVDGSIPFKS